MWSEEDGEFVATCNAFPRLSAFGETEEEALKEGKIALKLFIEACLSQGIPLPEPQVVQEYSGQVRLRLSKYLHQQAARRAEAEGVSLNTFFVDAIAMRVGAETAAEHFLGSASTVRQLPVTDMMAFDFRFYGFASTSSVAPGFTLPAGRLQLTEQKR